MLEYARKRQNNQTHCFNSHFPAESSFSFVPHLYILQKNFSHSQHILWCLPWTYLQSNSIDLHCYIVSDPCLSSTCLIRNISSVVPFLAWNWHIITYPWSFSTTQLYHLCMLQTLYCYIGATVLVKILLTFSPSLTIKLQPFNTKIFICQDCHNFWQVL